MNKQINKMIKQTDYSVFLEIQMLPLKEKRAVSTLYAFCKHLSDILQSNDSLSQKEELIKLWYQEIDNIYQKKTPASNIGRDIYKNCMRFQVPKEDLLVVLNNVEREMKKPLCAPSMSDFENYCFGMVGAPSKVMLRILGCKDEKLIKALSLSLGKAVQITNILKNVRDDAAKNKLYIPSLFLKKAGIKTKKPQAVITDKNLILARQELAEVAKEDYKKAFELMSRLDKRTERNIKGFVYIYKKYFDMMSARGWEVISPKPKLNLFSKMFLIMKAYSGK